LVKEPGHWPWSSWRFYFLPDASRLAQALDFGINFFDTANVYSSGASEEVLGRFLKAHTRREAVVVATKVFGEMRDEPNGRGLSRKAIFYELDQSLRRLQTDYVDLYQIHRWDYETPIEETLEALHDVVPQNSVMLNVFPSGSLNHATLAPLGAFHMPSSSCCIPG
jgi:aryl-alcohol dehydrogenase-like predicted oxidoreductase